MRPQSWFFFTENRLLLSLLLMVKFLQRWMSDTSEAMFPTTEDLKHKSLLFIETY